VPPDDTGRPRLDHRLHGHRGGVARQEQRDRDPVRLAAVRRAVRRDVDEAARPVGLRPRPRGQPDPDHPGADHPLHRRRRPRPRHLAPCSGAAMTVHPAVRAWLERLSLTPRRVAQLGIVLGVLGSWLALPPLRSRLLLWPILVGILAVACGIWAISRAERRVGWGAVAAGLAGVVGGVLATRSSVGHLDAVFAWGALLAATLRFATPLTFAALGGLFSER